MKKTAVFIIALLLVGTLWADSIPLPPDPIISVRKDGGSVDFTGTATLFITDTSSTAGNANNCSPDPTNPLLVQCGVTDTGGNATSSLGTPVFNNVAADVFQLGYFFSIPQGTFSTDSLSVFDQILAQDTTRVILQNSEGQFIPSTLDECDCDTEFITFFAEAVVPKGGTLAVQITANQKNLDALNPPLPEPSTLALLSGGIGALLLLRRRGFGKRRS